MRVTWVSSLLERVALRRRLAYMSPIRDWRHRAIKKRQNAFRAHEPSPCPSSQMVHSMEQEGVYVTPDMSALLPLDKFTRNLRDAAVMLETSRLDNLESDQIYDRYPLIYTMGLDDHMLAAAESYLRENCFYLGCCLKRERVLAKNRGPRQWHRDVEDHLLFRVIVYLCEVDEDAGPFAYVPGPLSEQACARSGYRSGYLLDERMAALIDDTQWKTACGSKGTVVVFDGSRVFHRATPPRSRDRLSLTMIYSTRHPLQIKEGSRLSRSNRSRVLARLSDRQKACIPALHPLLGLLT